MFARVYVSIIGDFRRIICVHLDVQSVFLAGSWFTVLPVLIIERYFTLLLIHIKKLI